MEEKRKQVHIAGRTYKQWCNDNRGRVRQLQNEYHARCMADPAKHEMELARRKRWNESHKDQVNAMQRINSYIKKGMVRRQPCEICGAEDSHAHHDDYTRPLNVRWLCPLHHKEWHMNHEPKKGAVDKEKTREDRRRIQAGLCA